VAFVMGCSMARPDLFGALTPWAVAQLGGARDKYGWRGALGALSAARVAEGQFSQRHQPLTGAFLALVCEYLDDQAERGEVAICADYDRICAAYKEQHSAAHPMAHDVAVAQKLMPKPLSPTKDISVIGKFRS
jgi:hypothetical protein